MGGLADGSEDHAARASTTALQALLDTAFVTVKMARNVFSAARVSAAAGVSNRTFNVALMYSRQAVAG